MTDHKKTNDLNINYRFFNIYKNNGIIFLTSLRSLKLFFNA